MRQEQLREYLHREPFVPFRLHLSTGAFFDIRQPELADAGRSTLTIGFAVEGSYQRFVEIALVHIVWVEILLPAA
jgi:hypothetical protein